MGKLKDISYRFGIFRHHFARTISAVGTAVGISSFVAATGCLVMLVLLVGFDHADLDVPLVKRLLQVCRAVFVAAVAYRFIFRPDTDGRRPGAAITVIYVLMLSTAIQWLYPRPAHPWIPALKSILYSPVYISAIMAVFSITEISRNIMALLSRRLNPSMLLTVSFLTFILLGSLALMLPRCTTQPIAYVDSLFMATSAVCITGLTPLDVPSAFTPTGLAVLAVLIQTGGIGVLTFTSFFALFFSGSASVYNQLLIRDMVYSKTMNDLIPTLVYIIGFTLAVEALGAVGVYLTIPDGLFTRVDDKVVFAAFHSLSAFCNAGFSCLPDGMANKALMTPAQGLYNVTSLLIFAGAVGFPVLVNCKDYLFNHILKGWKRLRGQRIKLPLHMFDLSTKIALATTAAVLAIGTVGFFALEYDNTLKGLSTWQKMSQSLFNALIPRSAGFASLNPAAFMPVTLLLIVIQMWIGGASQSLAGGIKVNTLGVILLNVRAVLSGGGRSKAFGRSIAIGSVRRANTVLILAIVSYFSFLTGVMVMDPDLGLKAVMFETTSALFTVGSSLGITPLLCPGSKILLSVAMLVGRVGIISLLSGFISQKYDVARHLPQESVIIN